MVTISELYELSKNEWKEFFILFRACDSEVFHKSIVEGSWSPEKIFRHLLSSLIQINNNALLTEKLESDLLIKYNENPDDRITLEQIEKEYYRINEIVQKGMTEITEELENQNIKLGKREMKRSRYLLFLLAHEHNHFGQIIWILKRATKWSFEDIMNITQKKFD
ncbi:MAG: DinB family protein [Candidatus Heimdallarchaeota archaeon]|nr:DinB family protein [Candidatus Heimdallarchaeota archaeon]